MFGKRFAAAGICAVLAAEFLAGGTGLTAQAAVGDAAYTAAVNKAIMSDLYGNSLLSGHDIEATLASEITGKKLLAMSTPDFNDEANEIFTHNFTYVYDASGIQTATVDIYGSRNYPAEGPINCSITYDAAGYPTAIAVEEPTNYYVYFTWYNHIYQNTYDAAGRLSGVTKYVIRSASNPKNGEVTTPFSICSINYDASGRISSISEKVNDFGWTYDVDTGVGDYYVNGTSDVAYAYTYDSKNRIKTVDYCSVSSDGETWSAHNEYTYNRYGEVLTHTRVDSDDPTALAVNDKYSYKQDGTLKKRTSQLYTEYVTTYTYQ